MAHQEQEQFLDVIDRDEAERRFRSCLNLEPLEAEWLGIECCLGRVLAEDVVAAVDVPSFDRSNLDGYAVQAKDTFGADEERPVVLKLLDEIIATAVVPKSTVTPGTAVAISTGGMLPRGADAIVMIEHADLEQETVQVRKPVTAGRGVAYAGTDIGCGEVVVRRGERLTSRETGVLAGIGASRVKVWRRPRVAILSTGDEVIPPGEPMRPGCVFDSNARILSDAVREAGAEPVALGIVRDDEPALHAAVQQGLDDCDMVLLSGGTSKGAGDVSYRVVRELGDPGIVAHGVALKPGKPICLAVTQQKPVVILPGFPTSAIFTFHEFVAPILRSWAGVSPLAEACVEAEMAIRINSEIGRTEYMLVGLTQRNDESIAAYPMGKGSGSMTTFSRADGIVTIDRHSELVEAGEQVRVRLLGEQLKVADLVCIGSHCIGLDYLLGCLQERGFHTKFLAVGSTAGLEAAKRGECDIAGIHLLDPATGAYNLPFINDSLMLVPAYRRRQGVLVRTDDPRFENVATAEELLLQAVANKDCLMVNRNQGSGTRVLTDMLLEQLGIATLPPGYSTQSRSHHAVAAAIRQGRADWGIAIEGVATGLRFVPLRDEQYDFVVPQARTRRRAVVALQQLLECQETQDALSNWVSIASLTSASSPVVHETFIFWQSGCGPIGGDLRLLVVELRVDLKKKRP